MPKVTVVVPNFNHGRFLKKRLQTILDQTYQDFEIVYIDDASTDKSDEVLAQFENEERMRIIRNRVNSGSPFKQWNRGVQLAQGEYIWIAEADDYADRNFLARLVRVLDHNQNVGLAYCQSIRVDEKDETIPVIEDFLRGEGRWANDFINDGREECRHFLMSRNTILNASAVLFRRGIYEQAGYADENMFFCGDWMTWVKLLLISDIAFVAEPLNYYRTHGNSVRHRINNRFTYHEEAYRIVRYALDHVAVPSDALDEACQTLLGTWVHLIIQRRTVRPWRETRNVYRNARLVDRRFKSRLIKNVVSTIRDSLRSD
jgi:glycosyltransferase involved in cell wall biosynthesis